MSESSLEFIRHRSLDHPSTNHDAIQRNIENGVYSRVDVYFADRQCREERAWYAYQQVGECGLYSQWFGRAPHTEELKYGMENGLFTKQDVIAQDRLHNQNGSKKILRMISEQGLVSFEGPCVRDFSDKEKYGTRDLTSDQRINDCRERFGRHVREGRITVLEVVEAEREYRLRDPEYTQRAADVLFSVLTQEPFFNRNLIDAETIDKLKAMKSVGGARPFDFKEASRARKRFLTYVDVIRKKHVKDVLDGDVYKKHPDMHAGEAYKLGLKYGLLTKEDIADRAEEYTEKYASDAIERVNNNGLVKIAQLKALGRKGFLNQEQIDDAIEKIQKNLGKQELKFSDFYQMFYGQDQCDEKG